MTSGPEEVYQSALLAAHKALSSREEDGEIEALFVIPDESPVEGSACYISLSKDRQLPKPSVEKVINMTETYIPEPIIRQPPGLASLGIVRATLPLKPQTERGKRLINHVLLSQWKS